VIGDPSILSVIREDVVLVRVLTTFTFRVDENNKIGSERQTSEFEPRTFVSLVSPSPISRIRLDVI